MHTGPVNRSEEVTAGRAAATAPGGQLRLTPGLSVIVPAYDDAERIAATIESIQAQITQRRGDPRR
jgi:hypothetical protein